MVLLGFAGDFRLGNREMDEAIGRGKPTTIETRIGIKMGKTKIGIKMGKTKIGTMIGTTNGEGGAANASALLPQCSHPFPLLSLSRSSSDLLDGRVGCERSRM